ENKDSEIALLSQTQAQQANELKRQEFIRNIFVVVFALTAILLFTVYRSGQRRIRINKLLMEHQEEIKRRSLELEQLNQVKDKFFSIISHDLRSPMNALAAILDMADKKQLSADEFAQLTKELRIQFNQTKTLINNLLDWTLLQMDKLKIQEDRVDLRSMVDENFRLLSSLHLKDIQMINEIGPGTFAKADTNMVNLVFRNLILNGIKFTDAGGTIKVAARPENGMIVVSVTDNGVGIAPEVQGILFEKTSGYSTRGTANEKGTGLGLILCKEFVEKNGGTIWLESEPGKGSTFYFTVKQA
ncbi:MAG: sensor histidine kinase, partial [Bacteroidota bacterium]